MAQINYSVDESNPDINKGDREWLTYRWGYSKGDDNPTPSEWYKAWHKIEEPTFTERDIKGDPLSQYRGEFMGMPIKKYLLLSIQEDMDMILLEKQAFMKVFSKRYNELMNEAYSIKKIYK
jgi:hypothetical protein